MVDAICKDRDMALAILQTITQGMAAGTQEKALVSVYDWLLEQWGFEDTSKLTPEERDQRITELMTKARDCMNHEERREEAAFYLEGIISKEDFEAFEGKTKNRFIKQFGQSLIE
jgi:hypothetical protein